MRWVIRSPVRSTSQHRVGDAVVRIRLRAIQSIYGSRSARRRVRPGETREPKHVIERAVLEHQHEYVLDLRLTMVAHDRIGVCRRTGRALLRFAAVVTHDDSSPGGRRRHARRKRWCDHGDGTVQIRSAACPFPFPVPGYELPVTHRTASPDEAIALGSKDVHV